MKLIAYISAYLGLAFALCACRADEPDLPGAGGGDTQLNPQPPAAAIYIAGGSRHSGKRYYAPDDESGPGLEGVCRADELQAFLYTVETAKRLEGTQDDEFPADGDYALEHSFAVTPDAMGVMGNDRYAEIDFETTCSADGRYKLLQGDAIAYAAADKDKFVLTRGGDGKRRADLTLTLADGSLTPELYKGEIIPGGEGIKGVYHTGYGSFFFHNDNYGLIGSDPYTNKGALTGRIYRVVSGLNLHITEVPVAAVSRLELLVSRYPCRLGLHGSHGRYYPVEAVTDEAATVPLQSVGAVSFDAGQGRDEASFSAFLLPSEVGMQLTLRVTYRHAQGGATKDFPLRPPHSYYLTGDNAAVYSVGEGLKHGNDLYVYDNRDGKFCFYSYANVRVNLSGAYEDIALETGGANIKIEVEPNFEKEHIYDIE